MINKLTHAQWRRMEEYREEWLDLAARDRLT